MATRKTTAKKTGSTKVEANKHDKDTRTNIPTAELEKFAEEDEKKPTKLLYPRDPSLDPQLVWKGKDEQDAADLEVPAVPIYIQETIEPRAIIEDLRRRSKQKAAEDEPTLFADPFEELELEQRVDFYQHSGKWTNRMILGDSLLVMASLAEKEGLKGQVQMIYIDPPYGIKFGSNWQVSTRKRDVSDGKVVDATRQPEQVRAFRDTWELGIHSYLAYLRDRLVVTRDLLAESGSVFVQIGDENVHLARALLDEVFGSDNFCLEIAYKKTTGAGSPSGTTDLPPSVFDYLLWYSKNRRQVKYRRLFKGKTPGEEGGTQYTWVEGPDGTRRQLGDGEDVGRGRVFAHDNMTSQSSGETTIFPVEIDGRSVSPAKGGWKTNREGMSNLTWADRLMVLGNSLRYVRFLDDFPLAPRTNMWDDTVTSGFGDPKVFVVQTHPRVIERCLLMTTDPGDLAIDPTCGSGTTAAVAEQWGRRWITIDTSRVALALAKTRVMTSKFPYYLLSDSKDGAEKASELAGQVPPATAYSGDIKKGFVYERVPHVTLKSIANNPDIKEGMTREEIDAAIARHAETEILYDRPYEDKKVVRVTGPFTVESLSPHRVNVDGPEDEPATAQALGVDSARFVERIIEELRVAGVQNTYKGEKLVFDTLEPFAGVCVQATGTYREDGKPMTAAVALGPEYGTVGKEMVREAAKEAAEFADVLIVCGFAFEALVEEESKVGKLRILKAKMNPDLQMPDLLKKTGAGNLFMTFGEPDIDVSAPGADGMVSVEIRGLDVYDPTTGEVRSSTTDDIACWFIDTDYNEETFFVRHAYFCGGDKALREVAEGAEGGCRRGSMGVALSDEVAPLPQAEHRQDRRQGHQPLRRRDPQGLRGLAMTDERAGKGAQARIRKLPTALVGLIHHIELTDADWRGRGLRQAVLAVLARAPAPLSEDDLAEQSVTALVDAVAIGEVRAAIQELVVHEDVILLPDGRFKATEARREEVEKRGAEATALESRMREKFLALLAESGYAISSEDPWRAFQADVLTPLVNELGARAYELIAAESAGTSGALRAIPDRIRERHGEPFLAATIALLSPEDPDFRRYLLWTLSAQFFVEAAALSGSTLQSVSASLTTKKELRVFVDTNFVFSILQLHVNPLNEVAEALHGLLAGIRGQLNVTVYVLPVTVDEARAVLRWHIGRLAGVRLSSNLARAAQSLGQLSGLALRYAEAAALAPGSLTAEDFFGPYETNLLAHLRSKGVELFNESVDGFREDQAVIDDVLDLEEKQAARRRGGAKPYESNLHDMILWHFVSRKRPPAADSPLDVCYWIVTEDYQLARFDRQKRGGRGFPICVTPDTLMQLLRFWVPRDEALDAALVAAIRLPFLFPEMDAEAERTTVKILRTLSRYEGIEDMDEATITEILVNEALRQRIGETTSDDEDAAAIRDAIVLEAQQLERRLSDARAQSDHLADVISSRESELRDTEAKLDSMSASASQLSASEKEARVRLEEERRNAESEQRKRDQELADLRQRLETQDTSWRRLRLVIDLIIGLAVCLAIAAVAFAVSPHTWQRSLRESLAVLLFVLFSLPTIEWRVGKRGFVENRWLGLIRRLRSWLYGAAVTLALGILASLVVNSIHT